MNQQKMRETLNDIVRIAKIALNVNCIGNNNNSEIWSIIDKCKSALSEPSRNCDVGTVEEQSKRFRDFCKIESSASGGRCTGCRAICYGKNKCELAWAQMPYEPKGEANAIQ